jgi:osmoprotectant transport system ATP-binding protein
VLSPAAQAVGVDGDGRVLGVATFDQLRAAIQAADAADPADAPGGAGAAVGDRGVPRQ